MQQIGVTERDAMSVFFKDENGRSSTYSAYARGIDIFNTAYNYLDTVPLGRHEGDGRSNQWWVRRHDEYTSGSCKRRAPQCDLLWYVA